MTNAGRGSVRDDARAIAAFATPLLVNNLGVGGMLAADTILAGGLGPGALAAVAVGANYVGIFNFAAIGLMMALSPLVAHAWGAGRRAEIGSYLRQGLWLSLAASVVVLVPLLLARPVLERIGIPPDTARLAAGYIHAFSFGVPALCAFYALRFGSEGLGWTRPVMYTAVIGLCVNVLLAWALMYGRLGLPALGAVGAGYATAITWWLLLGVLWTYVRLHAVYRPYAPLTVREAPRPARLAEITRLGAPIAGSLVLEGGMFNAAGLLLATFGATVMAAHAVAINYAALMFMIPLSLNSATTIRVGQQLGRGDRAGGRRAALTGVAMGAAVMGVSALVMIGARQSITALYTDDAAVAALAAQLLLFAAAFQLADGLQVCTAGALRGYKDTRVPMILCLVAYWVVGFPLAWFLGVVRGFAAQGVWIGLIAGLVVAAVLLGLRLARISRPGLPAPAHGAGQSR